MSKISFVTDTSQDVVYTSEEPSLVMTYDRQLSLHSIWNLRQTKPKARFIELTAEIIAENSFE